MSKFSRFMKANKVVKKNEMYAATKSLCDENGEALKWEFKHITTKEDEKLRDECTTEVQVKGKPNLYRPRLNTGQYIKKMIAASVVMPDLLNAELQDSYGVKEPEDLLLAMVDDPGEYNDLAAFVQKFQGFNVSFEEKEKKKKN